MFFAVGWLKVNKTSKYSYTIGFIHNFVIVIIGSMAMAFAFTGIAISLFSPNNLIKGKCTFALFMD